MKKLLNKKSLFRVVALTLVLLFSLQSSGCLFETLAGLAALGAIKQTVSSVSPEDAVRELYPSYDSRFDSEPTPGTEVEVPAKETETPAASATEAPTPTPAVSTEERFASKPTERTDITFADIEYVEPDFDTLEKDLNTLLEDIRCSDGSNTEALLDRFDALLEQYNDADSVSSYCYVRYSQNVNDTVWQDRSNDISLKLTALDLIMTDCALALMDLGPEARLRWGDDFCDCVIAGDSLNDESVQDLFEQEEDLIDEYEVLIASYKVKYNGKTYGQEDLNAVYEEKGYDAYMEVYTAYINGFNEKAGAIYLKLLSLRNEIAMKLGYDNYAEYQYDCYSRDYTLEDSAKLHSYVKEYITPMFYMSVIIPYYITMYDGSDDTLTFETFLPMFKEAVAEISPDMTEALEYFLSHETYDMTPDSNKMESSYSTYISSYSMPFIFMEWEDDQRSAQTLTHEFGHYSNFYLNPVSGWSVSDSLDLCEIDSQGLEMLMLSEYDTFYGQGADYACLNQISDALYALISGCMEDEFQQYAYTHTDASLEELNEYYLQLATEYGLTEIYGYTGGEWAQILHSFSSPMYYISYAASVIPALQIWQMSQTNRQAAVNAYLTIMDREPYAAFRDTVVDAGLSDPFKESTIKSIAMAVQSYLRNISNR